MHADSLPRRRPFQRAGVTDELPPRVGPFALRRLGTMLDRTEAYVENKPDTCGAIHAQSQCGQRLIDRGIYVVQLEAWSVALWCGACARGHLGRALEGLVLST